MATVKFTMEAEEAKAVQAFLRVVDAQKKAERGAKDWGSAGKKAGQEIHDSTNKGIGTLGQMKNAYGVLAGSAGIGLVVAGAKELLKILDKSKESADALVASMSKFRQPMEDLFEATGAYTEELRSNVAKNVSLLMQKTGAGSEAVTTVANEMQRQFRGSMSDEELSKAQEEMIGYAVRHAGDEATGNLLRTAKGFGMGTRDELGAFRRQIGGVSGWAGLTDEEMIDLVGKMEPVATEMGWNASETMENLAITARGLSGRKLKSLPGATMEALIGPAANAEKILGLKGKKELSAMEVWEAFKANTVGMEPGERMELAGQIYGKTAAPGILKLARGEGREAVEGLLRYAESPEGEAAERLEQANYMKTQEAAEYQAQGMKAGMALRASEDARYGKLLRDIAVEQEKVMYAERPFQAWLLEWSRFSRSRELDSFAWDKFKNSRPSGEPLEDTLFKWQTASPREKYESIVGSAATGQPAVKMEYPPEMIEETKKQTEILKKIEVKLGNGGGRAAAQLPSLNPNGNM